MYRYTFFLTSVSVEGKWSASIPVNFIPRGKRPRYHWTGGWMCLRTGLDDAEKRKFLNLPGLEL
jgi:hypothetical protein